MSKTISMKKRITKVILEILAGIILVVGLEFGISILLIHTGQLSPAGHINFVLDDNATSQQIKSKMANEPFDYVVFDRESQKLIDGRYQHNNLSYFKTSFENGRDFNLGSVHYQYLQTSRLAFIVRQNDLPEFTNPKLRNLSYNQFSYLFVFIGTLLVILVSTIRLITELSRNFKAIQTISKQMGEVHQANPVDSHITEFSDILTRLYKKSDELADLIASERLEKQDLSFQVAALAHDVKTPLTVLQGNIELLELSNLNEQQQDFIQSMKHSLSTFERYFNSMIDYTRLLSDDITEDVEIPSLLNDIRTELEPTAKSHNVDFKIESNQTFKFRVNKQALIRSLTNIFVNACQYADDSNKQVKLSIYGDNKSITFDFWDNGIPFSEEALKNANKLFFTEDIGRSGKHYGIGLSFVEAFALKNSGNLRFENMPNNGVSVKLTLKAQS